MVDSDKGITNLHVPSNVIIDASMPAAAGIEASIMTLLGTCKLVMPLSESTIASGGRSLYKLSISETIAFFLFSGRSFIFVYRSPIPFLSLTPSLELTRETELVIYTRK